jgi:hypothetical protein
MRQYSFPPPLLILVFLLISLLESPPACANYEPVEGLTALIEIATSTEFVPTNAFLQSGEFQCSSLGAYRMEIFSNPEMHCNMTQRDHAVDVLMIYSLLPSAAELDAYSIAKVRRKHGRQRYVGAGALEF